MVAFEIRAATEADYDELYALAEHLDSVNLPREPDEIRNLVSVSQRSFDGRIEDPRLRTYVFVVRDLEENVAVGTSQIIAQLGTRNAPYIFFDVRREERYSATLDVHFEHKVLSIGSSYHGPTEIGGLVLRPDYRSRPEHLGMLISYVRFLFMATHRDHFQSRVLAELLPPLEEDGTSHLWEAVGRKFTGMGYREADLLSKTNKEFIRGLFPFGDIYVSLLPPEAQAVVGEVGPKTLGVAKMLRRIGFRYWDRVDPFDGGPHYIAPTDEIDLVQRTRVAPAFRSSSVEDARRALIAVTYPDVPFFRAVAVKARFEPAHDDAPAQVLVNPEGMDHLGVTEGDPVAILPLM